MLLEFVFDSKVLDDYSASFGIYGGGGRRCWWRDAMVNGGGGWWPARVGGKRVIVRIFRVWPARRTASGENGGKDRLSEMAGRSWW